MSEDRRNPETPSPENPQFFSRYDVRLYGNVLVTEFDYGFLSPSRMVFHAHNHAAVELIAVSRGVNVIDTMGSVYSCGEGTVLLIPHGLYHSNRRTEPPSERFCFRFYPNGGSLTGEMKALGDFLKEMTWPEQFRIPELLPIFEKIRSEMLGDAPAAEEMIQSLLRECYIHLLRYVIRRKGTEEVPAFPHRRATLQAERLKKIERFFSKRYAAPVTLKDLADDLYISPTQTNRILSAKYGQSFRQKLRDTRLHQARLLLESTDHSINEIAEEVGYASAAGFF